MGLSAPAIPLIFACIWAELAKRGRTGRFPPVMRRLSGFLDSDNVAARALSAKLTRSIRPTQGADVVLEGACTQSRQLERPRALLPRRCRSPPAAPLCEVSRVSALKRQQTFLWTSQRRGARSRSLARA